MKGTVNPYERRVRVVVEESLGVKREVEICVLPTYHGVMREDAYKVALAAALLKIMQWNLR